jgi:calnexin
VYNTAVLCLFVRLCRYKILIDGKAMGSGLLAAADFSPPLQPPAELPDTEHIKPEDWVEEEE